MNNNESYLLEVDISYWQHIKTTNTKQSITTRWAHARHRKESKWQQEKQQLMAYPSKMTI